MARWQINRLAVANSGQKYQIRPRRTLWAHGRRGFVWLEVGGWGITARFSGMALSEGIPRQEAAYASAVNQSRLPLMHPRMDPSTPMGDPDRGRCCADNAAFAAPRGRRQTGPGARHQRRDRAR